MKKSCSKVNCTGLTAGMLHTSSWQMHVWTHSCEQSVCLEYIPQ